MFDISKLNNNTEEKLEIDESLEFSKDKLKDTDIESLDNIRVKGFVSRIQDNVYHLSIHITGNMVLLCARSLEKVTYPLDIFVDKNIGEVENDEEIQVIYQNSLDIFEIVWENIVLEVPLRVVKEDASFISEGNGWSLIDEDELKSNSPFSELKSMLDMEGK